MTAGLRGAPSKTSTSNITSNNNKNKNKNNKNGTGAAKKKGVERGNVNGGGNNMMMIQSQSMISSEEDPGVFDIATAYPIIPPRTSSFAARGNTGFESGVHAAMMASIMGGTATDVVTSPMSGGGDCSAATSSRTPALPAGRQDAVATSPLSPPLPLSHTPPDTTADDTSAMSTPGAGTSTALPTPATTTPTGGTNHTLVMTEDHAQPQPPSVLSTPQQHLAAGRSSDRFHSAGSSQVSLDASRSSVVSRSPAAHPSSLATSWTNEGNTDGLSGDGHGEGEHGDKGEGGRAVKEEEEAEVELVEPMIKSGEVIDLVGGDGERESEDVWMRGRAREEAPVSHSPLPAPVETDSRMAEGEGYAEGDYVVPMGMATEAVSVWHPLGDDPLSKADPSQLLPEADHDLPLAQEQTQDVADTRRASIQFSEGCSSDVDERRRHVRRQRSSFKLSASEKLEQLRLRLKAPQSPQPWDVVDRPVDYGARSQGGHQEPKDGEKEKDQGGHEPLGSDYYSTLTSKNFATMQKSRRRPLIPHSSYYFGPPPADCAYGTPPVGHIGVHHPREIIRIERDYASGEVVQFTPIYPLELEGRITPTQFHETINDINEILISAYSIRHSFVYNFFAIATLQLSTLLVASHYTKEMRRLQEKIEELNTQLYNPVGLNILWPRNVAFLFLEIEYY